MGFARLAESSIRSIRGKGENDKLGAMDKILASSIGGALATWNQPIEVVRVEVCFQLSPPNLHFSRYCIDAINVERHVEKQASEVDDLQYLGLYLQGERHQGLVPWCHSPHWPWYLADGVHGLLCRLCQGLVRSTTSYTSFRPN